MSKEKIYTPKQFDRAVERYFESVSRKIPATELYDSGRVNAKGMPVMLTRPILREDGRPYMVTDWIDKPSITKLCIFLGITKTTFDNYARDEKYLVTATRARETIEAYLTDQLENLRNPSGVMFNLKYNFKWTDRYDIIANYDTDEEEDPLTKALREEAERDKHAALG